MIGEVEKGLSITKASLTCSFACRLAGTLLSICGCCCGPLIPIGPRMPIGAGIPILADEDGPIARPGIPGPGGERTFGMAGAEAMLAGG